MELRSGKYLLDSDFKFHRVERFDYIVNCTNFEQSDALVGAVLAAEHDYRDMAEQFVLLDPLQKVITSHSRHSDVGDYEVGGIARL